MIDHDKKYFMGFPSEKYLFLHKGHLKCQENISVFFLPVYKKHGEKLPVLSRMITLFLWQILSPSGISPQEDIWDASYTFLLEFFCNRIHLDKHLFSSHFVSKNYPEELNVLCSICLLVIKIKYFEILYLTFCYKNNICPLL